MGVEHGVFQSKNAMLLGETSNALVFRDKNDTVNSEAEALCQLQLTMRSVGKCVLNESFVAHTFIKSERPFRAGKNAPGS